MSIMNNKNLLIKLFICFFIKQVLYISLVFSQDTVGYFSNLDINTNQELKSSIELYQTYINALEDGEIDYKKFWIEEEIQKYKLPDLSSHYLLPKENLAIMGVSKIDEERYLLKTIGYMDKKDQRPCEIMYIYNYIVYRIDDQYKLGNYLDFALEKHKIPSVKGRFGEYYGINDKEVKQIDDFFESIEDFFNSKFNGRFTVIDFADNLESLTYRGYDYFIGSMNSKTTTSGLYNSANDIMYTTGKGRIHKHELLRSLHTLLPESPIILRNGFANLVGGSLGLSLKENIQLLYPFLKKNPDVLDDIDNFYYYDDQVVPHAVFTGLVTNYYLKKFGTDAFISIMKSDDKKDISIEDFLKKYSEFDNVSTFLIHEMEDFLKNGSEFTQLF